MSDAVSFGGTFSKESFTPSTPAKSPSAPPQPKESANFQIKDYPELQAGLAEASLLVDDIVLKNYLNDLSEMDVLPLDDSLKQISDIRLFKITEMVYQKNEYSTFKFASVFSALQNLNCGVFIIANSDGKQTEFYMGVRALDRQRTTKSLRDTLKNALSGQFPGVMCQDMLDPEAEEFLSHIPKKNIASVSCVAENKDEDFKDNEKFIQGLEKLALAMQGQAYTAVILARSTSTSQLQDVRRSYEMIYTQLSPFANMQLSYGANTAMTISDTLSHGTTSGETYSQNTSHSKGRSTSHSTSKNHSVSKPDVLSKFGKAVAGAALGIAGIAAAPVTGGLSIIAADAAQLTLNLIPEITTTDSTGEADVVGENEGTVKGEGHAIQRGTNENEAHMTGETSGSSKNMMLTMQNKTLQNTLKRIDDQLKRIEDCESVGMWECAAYFLSDNQETAEMAAGTYKALMKGQNSGVESSAINFWGRQQAEKLPVLYDYITNFIHPVFGYYSQHAQVPVSPATLVSSNELAIQMGLPRQSVCGFPVIEHADFGKEVVKYDKGLRPRAFPLGQVFSMGKATETGVSLDCNSLTMHTFVTGSTGSGKSNTVYEMLNQLRMLYNIPFLVVEPAKGEYKNVFGQFPDVTVYGTNPKKTKLLRINPFRFPTDVHVLEHLDRLVEIFNVCWPMYAAMPAILKEAMELAYKDAGWDMETSENPNGDKYPNFADLLEKIQSVIDDSKYSADSKGDYSGALLTRVRSLTTGLNSLIFTNEDLGDSELFDRNVIVDLSRVGSTETKSLIMGIMVMKLNEYRMDSGKTNSPLSHITVLEEAHNLLKRTSTEQSAEGSNLLGKSVEMLANSIAEMRTYGEGFIIADQSPGLMDMSVIRNTNTKIILRLPEKSDRELVGFAAGLNEEQIDELSKLKRGVAAVYQSDWVSPVLVQVNKCDIVERAYSDTEDTGFGKNSFVLQQLLNLLIQGRVNEKLDFDLNEIEKGLGSLKFSMQITDFIEEQLAEYRIHGTLEIWEDERFRMLSRRITDIIGARARVENCILTAKTNDELSSMLERIVEQCYPSAPEPVVLTLSQCLMKDMSIQQDEAAVREQLYMKWVDSVRERRA
mgnify:CR=1 FL=1